MGTYSHNRVSDESVRRVGQVVGLAGARKCFGGSDLTAMDESR